MARQTFKRRKFCRFTAEKIQKVDYKQVDLLKNFITDRIKPMRTSPFFRLSLLSAALVSGFAYVDGETAGQEQDQELQTVYVTAQRQLQQSLGVSKINAKDLERRPAVNNISDIIRTMPGANLTGNTASGERGNKRQIDIHGIGPENTRILTYP